MTKSIRELAEDLRHALARVERHKDRPRSDAYRKALLRCQDARHALMQAERRAYG